MRQFIAAIAVAAIFSTPFAAGAVGYEDSLDDCAYPATFDLMIMRPLSFTSLVIGSALFVPLAPVGLFTTPADMGKITENLIYAPARFTFRRRLGECHGVTIAY